jgi:hypothetical protein
VEVEYIVLDTDVASPSFRRRLPATVMATLIVIEPRMSSGAQPLPLAAAGTAGRPQEPVLQSVLCL